jgi:hypothetical protein
MDGHGDVPNKTLNPIHLQLACEEIFLARIRDAADERHQNGERAMFYCRSQTQPEDGTEYSHHAAAHVELGEGLGARNPQPRWHRAAESSAIASSVVHARRDAPNNRGSAEPAENALLARGIVKVWQSAWHGKLQDPKSENAIRTFAISTSLRNCLNAFLASWRPNALHLLFASRNGTPWDANLLVKRKLRPLLESLGIEGGGLHGFRRGNASLMDILSTPMKVRQQRLGHSDPRLTMNVYTHAASADDEKIAEQLGDLLGQLDASWPQPVNAGKEKGPAFQQALVN